MVDLIDPHIIHNTNAVIRNIIYHAGQNQTCLRNTRFSSLTSLNNFISLLVGKAITQFSSGVNICFEIPKKLKCVFINSPANSIPIAWGMTSAGRPLEYLSSTCLYGVDVFALCRSDIGK